jgi:ATP-binding cassette subfamily B protein
MRRLLGYLRPYWRAVIVALAAILGGAVLQLLPPYLTQQVIDVAIPRGDATTLAGIAAALLGVLAADFLLEYVQTTTLQMTGQRIMFDLRMQIYAHLQRLDVKFFDRNPVGRLMTRVTTDVDALNELFTSGVVSVFGDVFALGGIMIAMLLLDWQLALTAFAVIPLIALVTQWFRFHVRESYRDVRRWIARVNAFLQEHITGMATVQLFGREERSFQEFDAVNKSHMAANLRSIFYYAVFYPAIEIIGALATALLLWQGGVRVVQETLTLGTLVAFIQYAQRFFRPIQDLSEKFNILQGAMAASERIFQLLDAPVEIGRDTAIAGRPAPARVPGTPTESDAGAVARPDSEPGLSGATGDSHGNASLVPSVSRPTASAVHVRTPTSTSSAPGCIAFEHVWFSYDAGPPTRSGRQGGADCEPGAEVNYVLRDVSFTVTAGERIGIVGATGAGKTTIINLLLRFYDVTRGRILLDGADVRDLPLDLVRATFGLVLQDVYLFSGTIASNIRLGRDDISDDQVRAVLRAVNADRFVDALGGIHAPVVERGATLSMGQRQLLSFARALAFDPPVLVLDEATSSVDSDTEALIRDALRTLMHGRTTIAIAHRLSTIQDMDRVLVLHKGELREQGTHEELVARQGLYRTLYELQFAH